MKKIILTLSGIFSCLFSFAQTPQLVPGDYQYPVQNIPSGSLGTLSECIGLNNNLIFVAANQLWTTDGSLAGTQMLKQFFAQDTARPTGLTKMDNRIFFFANDGIHGNELWSTDGTVAGTLLVKDINPGSASSVNIPSPINGHLIYNLQVLGQKLYFVADDGIHGTELWSSDGTDLGTELFFDSYPGAGGGAFPPNSIRTTNDKLFFVATAIQVDTSRAIYSTDGNPQNIEMIIDDIVSWVTPILQPYGNKMILSASTFVGLSTELNTYISDGTQPGTLIIVANKNITHDITMLNSKAYFFTEPSATLMETDGTVQGTHSIYQTFNYPLLPLNEYNRRPQFYLTTLDNKLLFSGGITSVPGNHELWISDGTNSGTHELIDMWPPTQSQPGTNPSSFPFNLTHFNNRIYYMAVDSNRFNLFYTDGTVSGTQKVDMPGANSHKTFGTFANRYYALPMISTGNALFFYNEYDSTLGPRIYKLDLFPAEVGNTPKISSIDIYPNPSQGFITIDAENAKSITVHNVEGKLVYTTEHLNANKIVINTHSFATGTYTITTLYKDGSKRFGKFVEQ